MTLLTASKDFITHYLPAKGDVDIALAQSKREAAAAWFSTAFPQSSTAAGTVFGDMYVTPRAYDHAAFETAVSRLLGDIDLANIAAGGAFNCDLASAFVGNFETDATYVMPARGLVRLIFDADVEIELPGDVQFQINGNLFTPDVAFIGNVRILRVGQPMVPYQNTYPLRQMSATRFVAVIPVTGAAGNTAVENDAVSILRYTLQGLVGAAADRDFISGLSARTLSQRAKVAQVTYATASGSSRAGVSSLVARLFPEVTRTHVVMPWDKDSLRGGDVILGGQTSIDVFVRSPHYDTEESQPVVFIKGAGEYLVAEVVSKHPILRIHNLTATDGTTWEPGTPACIVYIQSTSDLAPLATCAGTEFQRVFIVVSTGGVSDLQADTSSNDVPGYTITVNYTTDPLIRHVSDQMHAEVNRIPSVDLLVRPFIPVTMSSMTVDYRAKTGVKVNADQAMKEIQTFVAECGGDDAMSFARICEIMTYARAQDVVRVSVYARALFSCADFLLPKGGATPVSDYSAMLGIRIPIPVWVATDIVDLAPATPYSDPYDGVAGATHISVNRRNMAFILPDSGIKLNAVE